MTTLMLLQESREKFQSFGEGEESNKQVQKGEVTNRNKQKTRLERKAERCKRE